MTLINPDAAASNDTRETSSSLATPAIHPQYVHINKVRVSSCASGHISTAMPLTVWKVTVRPHTTVPQVKAL